MSNKMQRFTVYLFLETALHVSGGISTHHQENMMLLSWRSWSQFHLLYDSDR